MTLLPCARGTTSFVLLAIGAVTVGLLPAAPASASVPPPVPINASWHAIRLHGTGTGQQDRVRIRIDEMSPGSGIPVPANVGAGSFTIEFWIRGTTDENPAVGLGGGVEVQGNAWKYGHMLVDRSILGGSDAEWGISIAGGRIRFGTGRATGQIGADIRSTIEGHTVVLDGEWHHIACVRDATSGRKRIFVDGVLDFETLNLLSFDDLSYPIAGVPNSQSPWNPYLVLGAAKHDLGPRFPSFSGWFDEFRVWNVARTATEIGSSFDVMIEEDSTGLVGRWRLEEGFGTQLADSSGAESPIAELIAGVEGNGEWASAWVDPDGTAPIRLRPEDLNGDGVVDAADLGLLLTAWGECTEDEACIADLSGDGVVDGADLGLLLASWG